MGVTRVNAMLRVREGDELVTAANFEMENAILEVTGNKHFPLLAGIKKNSLRVSGFELDFDVNTILYSFVVCVEMMHQV